MGERKVINKYYPPDFDQSKLKRTKQSSKKQMKVRNMLPMSIRCRTCGTFISKGTKFNSSKEVDTKTTYIGIKILRFYFKCNNCSAEFTLKTDPKNDDYVVEFGATRNFEPWQPTEVDMNEKINEKLDIMNDLEKRSRESKREIDIDANLDELMSLKSRHAGLSTDKMLEGLKEKELFKVEEEEASIKRIYQCTKAAVIHRIDDDDNDDEDLLHYSKERKRRKVVSEDGAVSSVVRRVTIVKKPSRVSVKEERQKKEPSETLKAIDDNYASDEE
ncbi:hypothetical protein AQUCO_12300020v1 [Aquilegia coerulea]|uniref:Splicing factor YJU2 n=1 Tax=Aquilegia coerulea TaxID=218851 RepID=A0A2G5C1R1_AQUCA|nr:hypothetical protein AQUCO_12300020v1 [Aquilegia coerulea]